MVEYDLIGKQFGHLTVIAKSKKRDKGGYNHKYHQGYRKTLAEALELREELRKKVLGELP